MWVYMGRDKWVNMGCRWDSNRSPACDMCSSLEDLVKYAWVAYVVPINSINVGFIWYNNKRTFWGCQHEFEIQCGRVQHGKK